MQKKNFLCNGQEVGSWVNSCATQNCQFGRNGAKC